MTDMLRRSRVDRAGPAGGFVRLLAHTDPVALVGILLSISLSVTLDLTNAATGVESLLAGLMGTTISLLVDSLARAERRFHLRTLLEGPPWLVHAVPEVVTGTREAVERHPGTRVAEEARRRFERFRAQTEQLRAGRIVRPGDDCQDLLGGTRDCVRRLDAVTNVMPRASGELSWWRSDIGRHYWAANVEALGRGVRITRVFLHAGLTDELTELVRAQRRAGVRVGLLPWGVVDASRHVNLTVWDGTACWEGVMSAHGEITENQFSVNAADLARLTDVFDVCVEAATFLD
ncbi:hypothetical protein M8C17_31525 [Micromonospora sp. RHAY321]|uniref:hypothetical protein n=1 Tax=Micromonospora sp. RHAY321 TaxID=2944807 RepID=UPI00207CE055|nr:hypothetical protein [Micromonospora sp. RHAY321]MCO1599698.1 hypothetical protein [Micromonospora sp. RHAY321]